MKSSCINHPQNEVIAIVREWQKSFCKGAKNPIVAGALLSFFEYWHNIKTDILNEKIKEGIALREPYTPTEKDYFQFHTQEDLVLGIMEIGMKDSVIAAKKFLITKGCITEHRNPSQRYAFDNTIYYQFHPDVVNKWLSENRQPLSENRQRSSKNRQPLSENRQPLSENRRTITETTTEITAEKEREPSLEKNPAKENFEQLQTEEEKRKKVAQKKEKQDLPQDELEVVEIVEIADENIVRHRLTDYGQIDLAKLRYPPNMHGFCPQLVDDIKSWIKYCKEKNAGFTQSSAESFISTCETHAQTYKAVAQDLAESYNFVGFCIKKCLTNSWKQVYFKKEYWTEFQELKAIRNGKTDSKPTTDSEKFEQVALRLQQQLADNIGKLQSENREP